MGIMPWFLIILFFASLSQAWAQGPTSQTVTQKCRWQNIQIELTMSGGPKVQEQGVVVSLWEISGEPVLTGIGKAKLKLLSGTKAGISLWPKAPNQFTGSAKLAFDRDLPTELLIQFPGIKVPPIYFRPFVKTAGTPKCSLDQL